MRLKGRFPRNFIGFLRGLEVSPNNLIVENVLDKESDFISQFYTPQNRISELGRKVLEMIQGERVSTKSNTLDKGSLGYLLLHTDFLSVYPNLKTLFRIILLESFSLETAIDYQPELRQYMTEKDVRNIRETLKFCLDVIGLDPRYTEIIQHLHDLNISLGYVGAQVPVIKSEHWDGEENG